VQSIPRLDFIITLHPPGAFVALSGKSTGRCGYRDLGDLVLAEISLHGRGRRSGVETEMGAYQPWTLREGKVVRGQAFTDRDAAVRAAGLRDGMS
jgi:hypothetical protein